VYLERTQVKFAYKGHRVIVTITPEEKRPLLGLSFHPTLQWPHEYVNCPDGERIASSRSGM